MYRNTPSKLQLRDTLAINVFTSLKKYKINIMAIVFPVKTA